MKSGWLGLDARRESRASMAIARLACIALIVAGVACAAKGSAADESAEARSADAPKGSLLIVGGGPQPDALVQRFVDLAGGAGKARIVVFAMASEDGLQGGEEKADDLRKLGAHAINVYITHEQANQDSIVHLLDDATGIWFGGGDQSRLTRALAGTKVEDAIHARYRGGAVVGGTSAGAAVMSTPMITGDERHPGGARPDTTDPFKTIARDNIITAEGFGLIDGAIIDQHFLRRKRHNRLVSAVLEHPKLLGVGIDESTALLVQPDGTWHVLGASEVVIYDARHAAITPSGAPTLGATGLTMHVLPAGSSFDPRSGSASLPTVAN
ncbi:MAG TPA: cyanophycinase [Gemmatimonadaceae bacterium]|nr:cyanophycinase [Gemmatimonadaceae bacterium]